MDRKSLRELENKCIQEEAPACVTTCPIHVDARTFLSKVAVGAWDEAVRVLASVMPLPGIVGRICDHPCESACRRKDAGGAVAIAALERTALERGKRKKGQAVLAARSERVAVIGGGLSGLAAAWDLAHKGYGVTILFEGEEPARDLRDIPEDVLPVRAIEGEMDLLRLAGVGVRPGQPVGDAGLIDAALAEFDAVYLSEDRPGREERLHVDPVTLSTPKQGLFAGWTDAPAAFPLIGAVYEGRKAATSIDRFLQKVSMTAGREHEGPYQSRLYTSLEGIDPRPVIPPEDPAAEYGDEEARQEAGRCIRCECMECVKKCLFLERFGSYPRRYVRQIGNEETFVMGSHGPTTRLVNSCTLCGLCGEVCPNGLSMAGICMDSRASLVRRGKMAPSAHDFALEDMLSSNSERAVIAMHEPKKDASAYVFFPGCQMAAIYPEHVIGAYSYLRSRLPGGVGLMLRCCGAPAEWAAREDLRTDATRDLKGDWQRLGGPVVIVACPTCYRNLKKHTPEISITSLWQTFAETAGAGRPAGHPASLAVHDPCTARHETGMQDAVRSLLARLGHSVEELDLSRDMTECCGFGGLMSAANPALGRDVARRRASESPIDYVTYCAMCRNALAASGKRVVHLLDLLLGGTSSDPAALGPLGYSDRSENRFRLKRTLLESVWEEKGEEAREHEPARLLVSDDVAALMEERRILREDVREVIRHGEASGDTFYEPGSNRWCASFRPSRMTYWVEYSPEENGFRVHNAYCHRMEIVEEGG